MANPSRTISWQQLVMDADPDWMAGKLRPWIYEFSNGRTFFAKPDPYDGGAPGVGPGTGNFGPIHGNGR